MNELQIPENFTVKLNTPVITPEGRSVAVYAECTYRPGDSYYIAYLRTVENPKSLGYVSFNVVAKGGAVESSPGIYRDKHEKLLPYVNVKYVENYTLTSSTPPVVYSQVGAALQEFIFRVSVQYGFEGRVAFEAYKASHYFHYKNGFRACNDLDEYYYKLAEKFYAAEGKKITDHLSPTHLYLPRHAIQENLKKFGITGYSLDAETETLEQQKCMQRGEALVEEALHHGLAFKVLLAIQQYGLRQDAPQEIPLTDPESFFLNNLSFAVEMEKYERINPSLFCQRTARILKLCHAAIKDELPMNPPETLAIIVMGAVIMVASFQDKSYGPQARYEDQLLYPIKFDDLIDKKSSVIKNIMAMGRKALVDKTIPYSHEVALKIFPALSEIPELELFLQNAGEYFRANQAGYVPGKN